LPWSTWAMMATLRRFMLVFKGFGNQLRALKARFSRCNIITVWQEAICISAYGTCS
jgi:hypothetical protein